MSQFHTNTTVTVITVSLNSVFNIVLYLFTSPISWNNTNSDITVWTFIVHIHSLYRPIVTGGVVVSHCDSSRAVKSQFTQTHLLLSSSSSSPSLPSSPPPLLWVLSSPINLLFWNLTLVSVCCWRGDICFPNKDTEYILRSSIFKCQHWFELTDCFYFGSIHVK